MCWLLVVLLCLVLPTKGQVCLCPADMVCVLLQNFSRLIQPASLEVLISLLSLRQAHFSALV